MYNFSKLKKSELVEPLHDKTSKMAFASSEDLDNKISSFEHPKHMFKLIQGSNRQVCKMQAIFKDFYSFQGLKTYEKY